MKEHKDQQQAVKIYKALGEPTRLKIALLLKQESDQCCSVLEDKLQTVAISTLSHHLKQMAESGLLTSRKEGTFIYYSLDKEIAAKYAPYLLE
ncbi:metalloregulator ArsR/SmtB family transcription factor [Paenibacillus sp. HJL G12]|uniref:Metalloregulator ArsR/SmtB family transcription factor n=1 Tax=Paenibacillus dendrobii TaxID=2691084 RepID=A0A7X3INF9_9BACL|nr:metalloregulator ArsR/SmtB family transcription factor [Paenibacillus dendrobii]MWV46676.1 metalloregulator ArsR/SmtB family transcription factor [Paenibacillus dendrobii]